MLTVLNNGNHVVTWFDKQIPTQSFTMRTAEGETTYDGYREQWGDDILSFDEDHPDRLFSENQVVEAFLELLGQAAEEA